MDEKREERQKESIDEILSDLNDLFNRMPALLDGIRLPDINPVEVLSPQMSEPIVFDPPQETKPETESEPASDPAFVPASECGKIPDIETAAGEEHVSDIAVKSEENRPPDTVSPEETDKLVPLSLGEYMFSQNAQSEPEPERRVPSAEEIKSVEGEIKLEVYHPESLKEGETDIKDAFLGSEKAEDDNDAVPFETTRDFGVPDIDALIQLSQEKQAAPMPGTAPADDAPLRPESVIEPALPAATVSEAEPQPALETDSGNIEIAPRAGSADGEGEIMKIEKENAGKEEPSKPIDAIESSSSGPAEPTKQAPQLSEGGTAAVDSRIERSSPQEFTLRASEPALKEQGLVIEQTGSVFNSNPPAAAAGDADKTTVIPPPPVRPEDEKTVIYEAGANPGVVSRGRTDLGALAGRPVPDGIPPERVRTVAFLYAQEDASLCADMLAELDAICLKSTSKPIFIKRGFVQACAPGVSGPVYMQKVADAGAMGLILVGNVPQDNVYELENVFIAGGVFFRHFPQEAISHSSALELVTELILK